VTARPFLIFLAVVILTAFFVRSPHAHDIHCVEKDQAKFFEPRENWRGYGISAGEDRPLARLSVSSDGIWMLTLSPPKMNGAVCVVLLGENWEFISLRGQPVLEEKNDF